jgi:DNA polymerase I
VTNAAYGFTSMLILLLTKEQPDGIAVAFDRPEPTFRHEMVVDYKAGRSEAPDILRQQMGLVRQIVETLKVRSGRRAGDAGHPGPRPGRRRLHRHRRP